MKLALFSYLLCVQHLSVAVQRGTQPRVSERPALYCTSVCTYVSAKRRIACFIHTEIQTYGCVTLIICIICGMYVHMYIGGVVRGI